MNFAWFVASILISGILCEKENNTLLLVQMLLRHGDRAPNELYPTDPNTVESWPEGLGHLTKLGKKQLYALGEFLRSMYRDFITSSPNEVLANCTQVFRTQESAQTLLASMYAPTPEWRFEKNVTWQPIPISYLPLKKDKYLHTSSECPRSTLDRYMLNESIENKNLFEQHRIMLENLTFYSGASLYDWRNTSVFYDTLMVEKVHNLTIPGWVEPFWDELENLVQSFFSLASSSRVIHRLRAGPFLQTVIENMNKKVSGKLHNLKVQLYSSHDHNIVVVLQALGLYNGKIPPYCATLIFELYERQNGEKLVRLLYQNSSRPAHQIQEPHVLTIDGCSEFCPLDFFTRFTHHLIPDDWEEECQIDYLISNSTQERPRHLGAIFFVCFGVGIVMTLATCSIRKYVYKCYSKCRNCISKDLQTIPII